MQHLPSPGGHVCRHPVIHRLTSGISISLWGLGVGLYGWPWAMGLAIQLGLITNMLSFFAGWLACAAAFVVSTTALYLLSQRPCGPWQPLPADALIECQRIYLSPEAAAAHGFQGAVILEQRRHIIEGAGHAHR